LNPRAPLIMTFVTPPHFLVVTYTTNAVVVKRQNIMR
jgi:hypothetical protein